MFRKVHLYLTALCAGITTAIILVMSLLYLYISENELYENQYRSFQNDMNTIATGLEQQSVISMEWLSKMESHGAILFMRWITAFLFSITVSPTCLTIPTYRAS